MGRLANALRAAIEVRFFDDFERMAVDMLDTTVRAMDFGDIEIVRTVIGDDADDIKFRSDLAVDSAAWQGFELGRFEQIETVQGMLFDWELDPGAQHCDTCLFLAQGGPYTADEAAQIGVPGQADTICNGSCRCNWVPRAA